MRFGKGLWPCAAPLMVVVALGLLAGCGGGGGTSTINPTATPSPSASAILGVIAQQVDATSGAIGMYSAKVEWSAPASIPTVNIVEYHILRNNVIVGVVARSTRIYYDAVGESFGGVVLNYYTINADDNTKLNLTHGVRTELQKGDSVSYRVTALYITPETAASATPEYAETDIGQSTTFTIQ